MRLLLAVLLATAVSAGEATDPIGERIAAGFAAWVSGDGAAACAVWTEGALPAAGAEATVIAEQLDAVPAAARNKPVQTGPPAAWSAWFELSWGELPDGLAEEQIPTAQLPQAVLLTLE